MYFRHSIISVYLEAWFFTLKLSPAHADGHWTFRTEFSERPKNQLPRCSSWLLLNFRLESHLKSVDTLEILVVFCIILLPLQASFFANCLQGKIKFKFLSNPPSYNNPRLICGHCDFFFFTPSFNQWTGSGDSGDKVLNRCPTFPQHLKQKHSVT